MIQIKKIKNDQKWEKLIHLFQNFVFLLFHTKFQTKTNPKYIFNTLLMKLYYKNIILSYENIVRCVYKILKLRLHIGIKTPLPQRKMIASSRVKSIIRIIGKYCMLNR